MKFEEILPALREGKKVTSSLVDGINCKYMYYSPEDAEFYTEKGSHVYLFSNEFMTVDDWEIIKEKKKVKLRDLTEEQCNKWIKNNCPKYDDYCHGCPFQKVKCHNHEGVKDAWYLNKDLYSDKFLDQEIEIEEE